MPAKSKSQQRLFGMVHAYQKGKLRDAPESVKEIARSISDEDAEHFAKTKHKGLPEKKAQAHPDPNYASRRAPERKKRSFLRDLAALSTAASPFLVSTLFKGRGKRLSDLADKALGGPKARLISLQDAAKAAMKESKRWGKAGYKFDGMRIAEQDVPGFADLSRFMFDASKNTGNLRVGVKSLADAHSRGIGADMFFHELGHAHDAYNQAYFKPKTLLGRIWNDYVGKNIMPYRWNPVYKEELRAWENAKKLSRRKISQESIDAALNTYRNDIYRRNAMTLSGLGSAALIGNRFFGGEKSAEYRQGFMDKLAGENWKDRLKDYFQPADVLSGTASALAPAAAVGAYTIPFRGSILKSETKGVTHLANGKGRSARIINSLKVDGKPIREFLKDNGVDLFDSVRFAGGGGPAFGEYRHGSKKKVGLIRLGFKNDAPKSLIEGMSAHELGHAVRAKKPMSRIYDRSARLTGILGLLGSIRASGKDVSGRDAAALTLATALAASPMLHEEIQASRVGSKLVGLKGLKRLPAFSGVPTYAVAATMPGIACAVRRGIEKARESRKKS